MIKHHFLIVQNSSQFSHDLLVVTFTILGGILLFVAEKLIERAYMQPINSQKGTIEDIAVILIRYAVFYSNPEDIGKFPPDSHFMRERLAAMDHTRELSALLSVKTNNITAYNFWYRLRLIRVSKENANKAAGEMMRLSNSYFNHTRGIENSKMADEIRVYLSISKFS